MVKLLLCGSVFHIVRIWSCVVLSTSFNAFLHCSVGAWNNFSTENGILVVRPATRSSKLTGELTFMGSVWEFFFPSVSADVNGKKVQSEDTARLAGQTSRKDSNVHGKSTKGKPGQDNKPKVGQDDIKSIKKTKVGEVEKKAQGKTDISSTVVGKSKSDNVAQKETLKSAIAAAGVSNSPVEQNCLRGNANECTPDLKQKNTDDQYRDCGHVRTKRVDLNLPDHIDQSELEPIQSLVPECYKLKVEYDQCFQHWFAHEFLNGATSLEPCKDLMHRYTTCVKKGLEEQNLLIYPSNCLNGSSDPNDRKLDHPRKKPPHGATIHKG
ncbi:unnamed protein product [Allacma fusca]|uniref:Uncharacterized protein n=1 Tax=Allacma fusca TaxID=39272 RepID=A0A8J2NL29_9HEXA|nr:unnamed protein product [Allacma fusca]